MNASQLQRFKLIIQISKKSSTNERREKNTNKKIKR